MGCEIAILSCCGVGVNSTRTWTLTWDLVFLDSENLLYGVTVNKLCHVIIENESLLIIRQIDG